jgi:hypothetical protein
MKQLLALIWLVPVFVKAQTLQIPSEITFHTLKAKTTIGTESNDHEATITCLTFRKVNNNVTALNCDTHRSDVVFMISGTQDEKTTSATYTITFNGFHYLPIGTVKAYLTYGFDYTARKWYVSVEDVLDNDQDGVARMLFQYYDKN